MDDANDALHDWFIDYHNGELSNEAIRTDVASCIEHMRKRGWRFSRIELARVMKGEG